MRTPKSTTACLFTVCLTGAAALAFWAKGDAGEAVRGRPIHPVAALAWLNANCPAKAALAAEAPRIQSEDLLIMTAALDQRALTTDRETVCRDAENLSRAVSGNGPYAAPAVTRLLVALQSR